MTERTLPDNPILIPYHAKCVFRGQIFEVYQWEQELFDGSFETFEMLKRPDSVMIIAIDADGQAIAVDEEQPNGINRINSLVGGRVDPTDETTLSAAQREIEEETGWRFRKWQQIDVIQPESKIEWFVHLFLAEEPYDRVDMRQDGGEKITDKSIPLSELADGKLGHYFPKFRNIQSLDDINKILQGAG